MPRVTIGVFCYNQEPLVRGAINSALAQQPAPVDLVVADDGSSDGSVDVIREVLAAAATPTTLIADGVNRGLATRLNQALDAASGDWVVWLAADDLLLPTALADLTAAASDDVDVVFGDLDVMDELGRPRGYSRPRDTWQRATAERYRDGRPPLPDMFEVNNFVPGGMCLIRRRALRDACGYDPAIRTEDLDMWLRIGWASRFRYVGRSVGRYRVVPGSTSRSERQNTLDQARIARKTPRRSPDAPGLRSTGVDALGARRRARAGTARCLPRRGGRYGGRGSHGAPPRPAGCCDPSA